jgi:tetratricopeptide (TPR) repeat protein
MRGLRFLLLFLSIVSACQGIAQRNDISKLLQLLKNDKEDTNKVNNLVILCDRYRIAGKMDSSLFYGNVGYTLAEQLKFNHGKADILHNMARVYGDQGDYTKALAVFSQSLSIRESIGDDIGIAGSYCSIGVAHMDQGDYSKALEYYLKAKDIYEKKGDKDGLAPVIGNIGIVYRNQGNYPLAIEYYFKAMKMYEEAGSKGGVATNAGNLGVAYMNQEEYEKALQYYNKALNIYLELDDKDGIATNQGNMGIVYVSQKNYPKALEYFFKSLVIYKEIGDKDGVATNTGNIGHIYYEQADYNEALKYFTDALKMDVEVGDKDGIAVNTGSLGEVYLKEKQYDKAEKYIKAAINLADSIHEADVMRDCNLDLSKLYRETGKWEEAYNAFKTYTIAKDSLVNQDKNKEIGKLEAKEEYDKQLAVQQTQDIQKAGLATAESKRQKLIIGFTGIIALAVAFVAIIIFRSLKTTRGQKEIIEEQTKEMEERKEEVEKQKEEIEVQKKIVEEKNKDIVDSITYAKRLQEAILPPFADIKKHLPETFVLYKPKDIVAGDFYWMSVDKEEKGGIIIAACDCTGHGVPGAMVSVVCSNALNRTVKEFKITEPGKILDKTRELVLETFKKSEGEIKDGMDISLASVSIFEGRAIIKWSGANIPLWYAQNGDMLEIVPDEQHIGKYAGQKSFVTHSLNLNKGDCIYLFTDGFAGQIGGPGKKKFGLEQLKEQLSRTSAAGIDNQKAKLEQVFTAWKGKEVQTDDVLVIGIKI